MRGRKGSLRDEAGFGGERRVNASRDASSGESNNKPCVLSHNVMNSTMPLYPCTWLDHSHIIKSVFVVHVQ